MSHSTDIRTRTVRAGLDRDPHHGAVAPPLHLSSNFTFERFGVARRYDYTRSGNPTRDLLAEALSELEGAAGTTVTASGMAAITVVLHQLRRGDLIAVAKDCYGGTYRVIDALARRGNFDVQWVDFTVPGWTTTLPRDPAMVWIETPSNPLLRITDVQAVATEARRRGATVVVDNTFLSPALQRPLERGADVVVHSTTKYLNGHGDVVGGAISAATEEQAADLAWWANCLGVTGAPFDSLLTLRGLRTLHARMAAHERNAGTVATFLEQHPAVSRVYYPGLTSDPGHELAARQQDGFGGMVSFELAEDAPAIDEFLGGLRLFLLAESLGGVESLVAHPATMTHAAMDPEARRAAGLSDSLIRLSVGIESPDDLVSDLAQALSSVGPCSRHRSNQVRPRTQPAPASASHRAATTRDGSRPAPLLHQEGPA